LKNQPVFPPLGQPMTVWVGVGGSPESVVRVVRQDLQLMLAIIGGDASRFAPYVDLYQRACDQLGKPVRPIGVHSPGFVAETDERAQEILWPHYADMFGRIGRERGWPPVTKDRYLRGPARRAVCGQPGDGGAQDCQDSENAWDPAV
jgi:alkanesulfonate monooxygenase SsuD/methylene tetrahydromethanopterin reductase-like flavin-dependent oxidoreductase (luciferase family)